jgi:holo-[acyl-carrier protein] synthase
MGDPAGTEGVGSGRPSGGDLTGTEGLESGRPSTSTEGVGIDLLDVDRLERALRRRPGLAERLFTDGERAYAASRGRPAMHLAARFCAKEAVAKALALRDGDWHDVEVLGGGDGAPSVRLAGAAAARASELGVEVEISLTHSKGMAGAVAMLR